MVSYKIYKEKGNIPISSIFFLVICDKISRYFLWELSNICLECSTHNTFMLNVLKIIFPRRSYGLTFLELVYHFYFDYFIVVSNRWEWFADHKINSPPHKCVRPYTLSQLLGEVGRDHFNINVMKLWIWCKHQNSSWDVKSRITDHWLRFYLI